MQTVAHVLYMIASVLFIIGIKQMSAVKTARAANALSALAMLIGTVDPSGQPWAGRAWSVRDEGAGFDPDHVPDPRDKDRLHLQHGRGVFLMRELMDHVEYRKGGREVLLFKRCVPAVGS